MPELRESGPQRHKKYKDLINNCRKLLRNTNSLIFKRFTLQYSVLNINFNLINFFNNRTFLIYNICV